MSSDELPEKPTVLIVEDDHITSLDLQATIRRLGFPIAGVAEAGDLALEMAEQKKPDLALLDIKLQGGIDGIELATLLGEQHGIPVVFLTGYSEDAIFERAREARPVGYLRKPFGDGELAACLEAAAERGSSQRELVEREDGIRSMARKVENAVIAADLDGRVTLMNYSAERMTGWQEDEAVGKPFREIVRLREPEEEDPAPSGEGNGSGNATRKSLHHRAMLIARDDSQQLVEERTAPIRDSDGNVLGLLTVLYLQPEDTREDQVDVSTEETSQPEAKDEGPPTRGPALESAEKLSQSPSFRQLLGFSGEEGADDTESDETPAKPGIDEIGDPLLMLDEDEKISYANAEALASFGGAKPLIGRELWSVFPADSRVRYRDDFRKSPETGLNHLFEFHDIERDEWHEVRTYRSGKGTLALFRDVTERKIRQAEQVRQQRLEGLSLLARGFAHDFNNHLTVITGNLALAGERHSEDGELQKSLTEARQASSRARNLVQQLMTFARGGKPVREFCRVPDLIRRLLADRRDEHPDVRYQFQCGDAELKAYLDESQVRRLIENLVANAEEAMTDGGVLIVRCGLIDAGEVQRLRADEIGVTEQQHLLIEVIDTGHGMDSETLDRAFEPYFTTRGKNNATGIGLTVCESIAKAHDGFIALQSKVEKGTIAAFCMPLSAPFKPTDDELPQPEFDSAPDPETVPAARILILEDEPSISRLMRVTLDRAGHDVVETANGRDTIFAYRDARDSEQPFDLVICDLTIEDGVGGIETIRALRRLDPDVTAIVSSGYSDAPAMSDPRRFGFNDVLPKPYPPHELVNVVTRVLARLQAQSDISQQG
ncbi:MAG: response regulator [Verrucomicrobiales bacterium]|nr:response regulator [Verrucomicrobiales bacterium]